MERFLNSLEKAIKNKNWYAALFIGLAIPDICGKIENPNDRAGPRYRAWFKAYVEPQYTMEVGRSSGESHIFLSADDCYALRCAYLHEGADDITEQNARETLERFHFIEPPPNNGRVHCNQRDQVLQLQVDIFCSDIISGVKKWLAGKSENKDIKERLNHLIKIYEVPDIGF